MYGDNCKLTHWAYWLYYIVCNSLWTIAKIKTREMSEPNSRKYLLAKISTYTVFHLKLVLPLWKVYDESSTGGVWMLSQRVYTFHMEMSVGYSTWNWYSLCERFMMNHPQECGCYQRVYTFHMEMPVGYSTWNWYSLCERFMMNHPQECGCYHRRCTHFIWKYQWAILLEIDTASVKGLWWIIHRSVDAITEGVHISYGNTSGLFHLKLILPLWKVYGESSTGGVWMLY